VLKKNLLYSHEWRHFVKHFLFLKCQRCRTYLLILLIKFLPFQIFRLISLTLHLKHILCIILLWIFKLIILNYNYFVPLVEIRRQTVILIENRENETDWLPDDLVLLIIRFKNWWRYFILVGHCYPFAPTFIQFTWLRFWQLLISIFTNLETLIILD
jgi:hypothetical protein